MKEQQAFEVFKDIIDVLSDAPKKIVDIASCLEYMSDEDFRNMFVEFTKAKLELIKSDDLIYQ